MIKTAAPERGSIRFLQGNDICTVFIKNSCDFFKIATDRSFALE